MNFINAAQHAHEELCRTLKVNPDWVRIKFENIPMTEYSEWLAKVPLEKSKLLQVEFNTKWSYVVYAEYLVAPEYASLA